MSHLRPLFRLLNRIFRLEMKLISSAEDIPELGKPNIHIRNREELLEKINKVIRGGSSNLQIVTDFDHTLTRHKLDNGSVVLTSFGE